MDQEKRERLEKARFRIGTVTEFLGLTPEQSELIVIKLSLTDALRERRKISEMSQAELAEKIGASQSRIAKIEVGEPHVSLDLMIRALLATGMTRGGLTEVIAGQQPWIPPDENPVPPSEANGVGRRRTAQTPPSRPQEIEA